MVEARSLRAAAAGLFGAGVDVESSALRPAGRVRHVLTHRELEVIVVSADVPRRGPPRRLTTAPYERSAWVELESDARIGISTLARKILDKG